MTNPEKNFLGVLHENKAKGIPYKITYEKVKLFHDMEYETSEEIAKEYNQWIEGLKMNNTYAGAIGGRLAFSFIPTSIGLVCKVKDAISNTEFDLTDYGSW